MATRLYIFTVQGHGEFPIDMLRYDACRPRTELDSAAISRSFLPRERRRHYVKLVGSKAPTVRRWESFAWQVEDVDSVPLR